jgi:hypothetical protein
MKESNTTTTHAILADPFASEEQWLPLCTTAIEQRPQLICYVLVVSR